MSTIIARQQWKRGTLTTLTADDLVYLNGEPVWITDMDKYVLGDGATAFTSLTQYPFGETVLTPSATTTYTAATFLSGQVRIMITSGSGSDITITLPDPTTLKPEDRIQLSKIDSGTALATVTATSGNINGASSVVFVEQYNTMTLVPNGSNYLVLESDIFYIYDWTSETDWANSTFTVTHNLGFHLPSLDVEIWLSETGSDTDSARYSPMTYTAAPATLAFRGMSAIANSTNVIDIQTGTAGVLFIQGSGAAKFLTSSSAWYMKVLVKLRII